MTTPDALREKVADAIYGPTSNPVQRAGDLRSADAAIRVVVEACAEVCHDTALESERIYDIDTKPQYLGGRVCASRIRALIHKETT